MQGQCPNCKGLFEIKQEWIGMKAPCPHCHQTITLLAMPSGGSPAASSINLDKGDSTPATPPAESVAQNQPAPAQAPASAPVEYKLAPQAPTSAPMQVPPTGAQAPTSAPVQYQQPFQYAGGPQLASVIERFIAMLIDGVIVGILRGGVHRQLVGVADSDSHFLRHERDASQFGTAGGGQNG